MPSDTARTILLTSKPAPKKAPGQPSADAYQIYRETSRPEWGGPGEAELAKETNPVLHFFKKYKGVLTYPSGDDPVDQYDIQQGFKYYDQKYGG